MRKPLGWWLVVIAVAACSGSGAMDAGTAGGNAAGGSSAGGSSAGGSSAGGSSAGGSSAGGSSAGGSTAGGSTAGGAATAGGSTAGGATAGGSTAGGAAGPSSRATVSGDFAFAFNPNAAVLRASTFYPDGGAAEIHLELEQHPTVPADLCPVRASRVATLQISIVRHFWPGSWPVSSPFDPDPADGGPKVTMAMSASDGGSWFATRGTVTVTDAGASWAGSFTAAFESLNLGSLYEDAGTMSGSFVAPNCLP